MCRGPVCGNAVEAAGLAAVEGSEVLRETSVGCVEVEEAGLGETPEAVHEAGWRADGDSWPDGVLGVVDEERQLPSST